VGQGHPGPVEGELRRVVSPAQGGHVEPGQIAGAGRRSDSTMTGPGRSRPGPVTAVAGSYATSATAWANWAWYSRW
jgi:hypothetical protein